MPQYLMFAENVYNKIKDEELFSHDCIENMNLLMTCIRREIEGMMCAEKTGGFNLVN